MVFSRAGRRSVALLLTLSFVAGLFAIAPVSANPLVPYCGAASLGGAASPSADALVLPEACEALTSRVFPEALVDPDYLMPTGPNGFTGGSTGFATDYVGYFEFQRGLEYLAAQYPDFIEVHEVATSVGDPNIFNAGGAQGQPIYILEISNENSPIPRDQKQNMLFMLSIHGNEKGGREGGFRVLEDLVKNIGFATETVQNGAGLPEPIEKPTGGEVQTYHDYLDFMNLFLLFPNADGWACDELEYLPAGGIAGQPGGCTGQFRRTNANGIDLNRQTPTIGWMRQGSPSHESVKEPEAVGYVNWLIDQKNDEFAWDYAIDIHGMLNHQNFGAIMLPAGSFSPQEMYRNLRLAETLKERWNADSHFDEWRTTFQTLEATSAATSPLSDLYAENCAEFECPLPGSALAQPSSGVSSSQFAEYYTVIDAIGYTDSGFSGDFFAQTTGLNAPGYDIELAYNHVVTGSQYQGPGALFNDYHVHMVRHIVKSFMDAAALDVKISYETSGLRTLYVPPTYVATNLDDVDADGNPVLTPGGWAGENPHDDAWDYGADQPFFSRPAKYWEDLKPFLCQDCGSDGAVPGVLERRDAGQLDRATLDLYDTLVIPGTAINQFVTGEAGENEVATGGADTARLQMILDWVDAGGNLVLTDAGLEFFDLSGLTSDAVDRTEGYMGGIRMDLDHELLQKVRGGVKQTYEPTPMGFGTTGSAPNWFIDRAAFEGLGGSVAGLTCPGSQLTQYCEENPVALGYVPLGDGRISFIGALLPDATEEFYHPYGLDHYATTYSGNQVMRNLLGWTEVFSAPPVVLTESGQIVQSPNEPEPTFEEAEAPDEGGKKRGIPGVTPVLVIAGLAAAVVLRRRR